MHNNRHLRPQRGEFGLQRAGSGEGGVTSGFGGFELLVAFKQFCLDSIRTVMTCPPRRVEIRLSPLMEWHIVFSLLVSALG